MMQSKNVVFALLLIVAAGCSPSPSSKDYVDWIRAYENGYRIKKEYNDVVLDVQYQPSAYMSIQRNGFFDSKKYGSEKNELDKTSYYTLTIASPEGDFITTHTSSMEEKQRLLYYFSYLFQNDIKLKKGEEALPCVLYHFERGADLNGKLSFAIGFENNESVDHADLVIQSSVLSALPIKIKVLNSSHTSLL
jgi:hypothetical protein